MTWLSPAITMSWYVSSSHVHRSIGLYVSKAENFEQGTFSNINLIKMLVHGAQTLLTYYHKAHQGYAPFLQPWESIESSDRLAEKHKPYLKKLRSLIGQLPGNHVHSPAQELFWTSQLFQSDWRPVTLVFGD